MNEKSPNKIKMGIWIDSVLAEKLRSLINEKYENYEKGLLSYEIEMALRHWISLHTNAQKSLDGPKKPNPTPKARLVFAQVKEYLLGHWYYELKPGQRVAKAHLEKAIMAIRGSDPRTIRKWLRIFHKMGLVKPVSSAAWEIA